MVDMGGEEELNGMGRCERRLSKKGVSVAAHSSPYTLHCALLALAPSPCPAFSPHLPRNSNKVHSVPFLRWTYGVGVLVVLTV
jgi:hypothetical protein